MRQPHLVITPSVTAWKTRNALIFDRKFYDGMLLYVQKWPGKITCIMSISSAKLPEFGTATINNSDLPFTCITLDHNELIAAHHLQGASIVLASGDSDNQLHLSKICSKENIKCVYIIEYIPETRYQIASMSTNNPVVKLRRLLYIWGKERKRVAAFTLCDGLQSNGTPAHIEYNYVNNNFLYFDTRVFEKQIIENENLQQRFYYLSGNKPLRLAFSGRLIRMKGADHLVKLALKLKQLNTPFQLRIYGTGDIDSEMKDFISKHHLENDISMLGAVDFYGTLLPELKQSVDLFVCLHRQSDPSCTYLETLSCGVPIVGYKNRAFAGLLEIADIGWGVDLNDVDGICKVITHLNIDRTELVEKSRNSAVFAGNHDFDSTFQRRIDHLLSTVDSAN
jgi:colanic acid/amylovoran biosynthesis glycosyltransferase